MCASHTDETWINSNHNYWLLLSTKVDTKFQKKMCPHVIENYMKATGSHDQVGTEAEAMDE